MSDECRQVWLYCGLIWTSWFCRGKVLIIGMAIYKGPSKTHLRYPQRLNMWDTPPPIRNEEASRMRSSLDNYGFDE